MSRDRALPTLRLAGALLTVAFLAAPAALGQCLDPGFSVALQSDVVYGTGAVDDGAAQMDLRLDVYSPVGDVRPDKPAAILIHGGSFTGGSKTNGTMVQLGQLLAARGFVAVSINYRLFGDDPPVPAWMQTVMDVFGITPSHPEYPRFRTAHAAGMDTRIAVRWLRENAAFYGVDPNRIAGIGSSAGAFCALVAGVIDETAFDFDHLNPADPILYPTQSPYTDVTIDLWGTLAGFLDFVVDADDTPIMIAHGTNDTVVPYADAQALADRATLVGLDHELWPLVGVGHGAPLSTDVSGETLSERIVDFLATRLGLCTCSEPGGGPAACGTCLPSFTLATFPIGLAGATPYTAPVVAVMDHKSQFYQQCCDTEIVAYTGESVVRGADVGLCPSTPEFPQCFVTPNCICEYRHPDGEDFVINGNYVGALFGPDYLSYDGHAGYDYGYGSTTPLVATADGDLCKAIEDPINGHLGAPTAWDKFHTFYIDHGVIDGDGYASWYLHADSLVGQGTGGEQLADLQPGECAPVAEGQIVASVGNFGTFVAHLHFEVRRYVPSSGPEASDQVVFDPYGWTGTQPDPLAAPGENPQAESHTEATWIACGNGRLECGEQCDDGNLIDGDCCSSSCQYESDGNACDDGDSCTGGETCQAGTCAGGADVCVLDPFKCYRSRDLGSPKFDRIDVGLTDQFGINDGTFTLTKPTVVCNPTSVDGATVANTDVHLTCYKLKGPSLGTQQRPSVEISDFFGTLQLQIVKPAELCVPSAKTVLP